MIECQNNELVKRIANRFNPDKNILFGSQAAGNPDNDIDLLIAKDTELPRHKRSILTVQRINKTILQPLLKTDDLASL